MSPGFKPKKMNMSSAVMSQVTVRDLGQSELSGAGAVVGRAVQDNPGLARIFERCFSRRAAAIGEIYGTILRQIQAKGVVLGALTGDDTLVGVGALVQPGRCGYTTFERIALTRVIQSCTSVEMALAYQRWQAAVARRDPKDHHWHIGPVAVEPAFQRKGIGTALMQALCARIDKFPAMAQLDTDRRESVAFFNRCGFRTMSEAGILEVPMWFMVRPRQR
jgi:ribosomal protein S18 acetylase RimI-like enzyme